MIFMTYWRVLLLCLAVLLPWRSTLAVTMVMTPTHHSTAVAMDQAPCPHHASASDQGSSTDGTTDHASCDVCHVPALSADLRTATPPHAHHLFAGKPPKAQDPDTCLIPQQTHIR